MAEPFGLSGRIGREDHHERRVSGALFRSLHEFVGRGIVAEGPFRNADVKRDLLPVQRGRSGTPAVVAIHAMADQSRFDKTSRDSALSLKLRPVRRDCNAS